MKLLIPFFGAAIVSAATTFAGLSYAASQKLIPGTACVPRVPDASFNLYNPDGFQHLGQSSANVLCPFVEDARTTPKSAATIVFVDHADFDTARVTSAQLCSAAFLNGATHCSPLKSNGPPSFTGNTAIIFADAEVTAAWGPAFADDYGSIFVSLPGVGSKLYGVTVN